MLTTLLVSYIIKRLIWQLMPVRSDVTSDRSYRSLAGIADVLHTDGAGDHRPADDAVLPAVRHLLLLRSHARARISTQASSVRIHTYT